MKEGKYMKYLVVLADGMADLPLEALGGKTPMEAANKPMMDRLVKDAYVGTVSNVPAGMVPESDTANLAVLSYDPKVYSKGRSPLEALSMGLTMTETQTAIRCNVVTLTEEEDVYEEKIILDHSADEITTAEADELIRAVEEALGNESRHFYTGISYRHCLLWKNASQTYNFDRPHDIIGEKIGSHLPKIDDGGAEFLEFQEKGFEILRNHPLNIERKAKGLKSANSPWLWSPGAKPALPSFSEKWGVKGSVISAVDLIKGIGKCAGMEVIDVDGATGNVHTNFDGKAQAAVKALRDGCDFVYVHVEAPDECGHRAELENKILSIELIDEKIIGYIEDEMKKDGEDYRFLILPDHPTPLALRTHTMDAVPYIFYDSTNEVSSNAVSYDEKFGAESVDGMKLKNYDKGYTMIDDFFA